MKGKAEAGKKWVRGKADGVAGRGSGPLLGESARQQAPVGLKDLRVEQHGARGRSSVVGGDRSSLLRSLADRRIPDDGSNDRIVEPYDSVRLTLLGSEESAGGCRPIAAGAPMGTKEDKQPEDPERPEHGHLWSRSSTPSAMVTQRPPKDEFAPSSPDADRACRAAVRGDGSARWLENERLGQGVG